MHLCFLFQFIEMSWYRTLKYVSLLSIRFSFFISFLFQHKNSSNSMTNSWVISFKLLFLFNKFLTYTGKSTIINNENQSAKKNRRWKNKKNEWIRKNILYLFRFPVYSVRIFYIWWNNLGLVQAKNREVNWLLLIQLW